jgi:hypothetical protein
MRFGRVTVGRAGLALLDGAVSRRDYAEGLAARRRLAWTAGLGRQVEPTDLPIAHIADQHRSDLGSILVSAGVGSVWPAD